MNLHHSPPDHTIRYAISGSKRIRAAVILGILLLTQLSAEARANPGSPLVFTDPIVGTWNVVFDITNCDTGATIFPGGKALALFNADGTRHETNASNPALRTPGYGNWLRVGKGEYQFAFRYFRFDASGAPIGSTSVRHDLYMPADDDSYYSEGTAEFLDLADNLTFVACSVATATRYE